MQATLIDENVDLDGTPIALVEDNGMFFVGEFQKNAQPIPQLIIDSETSSLEKGRNALADLARCQKVELRTDEIAVLEKRNIQSLAASHAFTAHKKSASCNICGARLSMSAKKPIEDRIKAHALKHGVGKG